MTEEKQLVCVNCPKGCRITVTLENGIVKDIQGFSCPQGKAYAAQETIRPMRVLTSTVRIEDGFLRVLPVITDKEIPLDLCEEAMEQIRQFRVKAPVKVGQVLIPNFLGTGANLVASRSMKKNIQS